MPIFQYLTFVCDQSDLQDLLTKCGLERWRLHTCEPVISVGPQGSGILQILVVMDRVVDEPTEEEGGNVSYYEAPSKGIAMKG